MAKNRDKNGTVIEAGQKVRVGGEKGYVATVRGVHEDGIQVVKKDQSITVLSADAQTDRLTDVELA